MQHLPTQPLLPAQNFIFWLQGFMEMAQPKTLDEAQVQMLKEHLELCFAHQIVPQRPTAAVGPSLPPFQQGQVSSAIDSKLMMIC